MVSITYKEPLDFFPSRSGIPARITATEIAELEVERTKFLSTASIDVHHPAYDRSAKPLLSFPALDDNGVDYDLLIHACYLLVNNAWPRDGRANDSTPYLSYSIHPRDKNPGHVIVRSTEGDTIVRGRCYLHVPGDSSYPITPSFNDWPFPHTIDTATSGDGGDAPVAPSTTGPTPHIPLLWRSVTLPTAVAPPRGITYPRLATIARDQTCRVTQYAMGVEAAHLIPKEAELWFTRNEMKYYSTPPDSSSIDHAVNRILLRGDVHHMLDRRELNILPKKIGDRYCFVLKVIKSGQDYLYDAYEIYHNRIMHDFLGVSIEYLFGRFAWNILHPETMPVLLSPRLKRPVRVYDSAADAYKVESRLFSEFKNPRSQSRAGESPAGGSRGKRSRSSGAGDDDDGCSLDSDDTFTTNGSDPDDEDSYQERLHSLDDYKACLAAMEGGEVTRGRKRSRDGVDRFSNASTEVDIRSRADHLLSKSNNGKMRRLDGEIILPTRDTNN